MMRFDKGLTAQFLRQHGKIIGYDHVVLSVRPRLAVLPLVHIAIILQLGRRQRFIVNQPPATPPAPNPQSPTPRAATAPAAGSATPTRRSSGGPCRTEAHASEPPSLMPRTDASLLLQKQTQV